MNKSKKKKKFTRIYSSLKTGRFYFIRIPKSKNKNDAITMKKYDSKSRQHCIFQNK